jgi:hypothetical protein
MVYFDENKSIDGVLRSKLLIDGEVIDCESEGVLTRDWW